MINAPSNKSTSIDLLQKPSHVRRQAVYAHVSRHDQRDSSIHALAEDRFEFTEKQFSDRETKHEKEKNTGNFGLFQLFCAGKFYLLY